MRYIFLFILLLSSAATAKKFYSDDPLLAEPKPIDVGTLKNRKLSDYYDFFLNQFFNPGVPQPPNRKHSPIRSQAVNTLGDPMDGDWYTRRHYWNRMSLEELKRGPGNSEPPDRSAKWTIIGIKSEGITPGFIMLDGKKRLYFVKFDPLSNPEMATSADQISSKLFYALGYWVPQNYLIYFTENELELGPNVQLSDRVGKKHMMTRRELFELMTTVPKTKDGKYRGTASLGLSGKTIGPPRYFGTRTDDPNDVVLHEHRRDQRAMHVFCAWVNHDDSRAINNLDAVVENNGVKSVRHHLLDFGATLGSASTGPDSPRSGDYLFSWSESARNFVTLGFLVPAWERAHFPNYPVVGRFEWKQFNPEKWAPEYKNPAFENRLPDDEFWAAKQVMAFRDEEIRAIVETAEISDPKAADWLVECLAKRRDKIGQEYFPKVLPLDRFVIRDGALAWDDVSGSAGTVEIAWHKFNNDTETRTPIADAVSARVPESAGGEYLCAELTQASHRTHKIFVYVRIRGGNRDIVGIDRDW